MSGPRVPIAVAVLARAPVAGQAKTRLIPALGPQGAVALHTALTARTLATTSRWNPSAVTLWCAPDTASPAWNGIATGPVPRRAQPAGDLGARMQAAAEAALGTAAGVILVGTDCPGLETSDLDHAAAALLEGRAVLGPARDGGYWLLGLPRPAPFLFRDVAWGTDRVLTATRRRLWRFGWRWRELAARDDIDRPEDLPGLTAWPELSRFAVPAFPDAPGVAVRL